MLVKVKLEAVNTARTCPATGLLLNVGAPEPVEVDPAVTVALEKF
jgi:hypothetical protein